MKGWFAALAGCAVLSELAEAMAPENWKTQIRRTAVLAAAVVMIAPLGRLRTDPARLLAEAEELLPSAGAETGREKDAYAGAAELVFACAEEIGVNTSGMRAVFIEEDGTLAGIRAEIRGVPYALRAELERELTEAFGVPATAVERRGG